MNAKKTFTGQNGWLDGRLELTPRPALPSRGAIPMQVKLPPSQTFSRRPSPSHAFPRLLTPSIPTQRMAAFPKYSSGKYSRDHPHNKAFYIPPRTSAAQLTPMREHASASGFSSEPFVSLR